MMLNEDAKKIFYAMEDRLIELYNKLVDKKDNAATQHVYWIGLVLDIDNELKKIKRRWKYEQKRKKDTQAKKEDK